MGFDGKSLDDYIDVAQRIADFRELYPIGTLQCHGWGIERIGDQALVWYQAAAYRTPDDDRPGIGMAWELVPGRTPYTRGSELQNAETSAWGRAIIAVGASDSKAGIASREEVRNRAAEQAPPNMWLAAPETREDGSATFAEQERMLHTAGLPSTRLPATPPDDQWYDAPPSDTGPADERPGTITADQLRKLHARLSAKGITDRAAGLAELSAIVQREVRSSKDLSFAEALCVIGALG